MASLDKRFACRGLQVIGVHSPEFDREKVPENVREQVADLGITYPVVMDNDFAMWEALGNRYWPSLYLVGKAGRIRGVLAGEVHEESPEAADFEKLLGRLLEEPAPGPR